jgi:hypothetical protein
MRSAAGSLRPGLLAVAVVAAVSCATRLPPRPAGTATPAPDAIASFDQATAHCTGLRTLTMELGLSGRAGAESLRGKVITGLQRGGAARLEGVAPFGAPMFILAARGEQATLLLPRDRRVLTSTSVSAVIEHLTGLRLSADDLLPAWQPARRAMAGNGPVAGAECRRRVGARCSCARSRVRGRWRASMAATGAPTTARS